MDLKVTTGGELRAVPEQQLRRLYGEKQAALLVDMAKGVSTNATTTLVLRGATIHRAAGAKGVEQDCQYQYSMVGLPIKVSIHSYFYVLRRSLAMLCRRIAAWQDAGCAAGRHGKRGESAIANTSIAGRTTHRGNRMN